MFNLEQSMAKWREQMLAAGIKSPVPLEELEGHLREEIERQVKSGMDAQRAFEKTVVQMGPAKELKAEFANSRGLPDILKMELIKKECGLKWGPILSLAISTGLFLWIGGMMGFKTGQMLDMTGFERGASLVAAILSCLLVWSGYLGYRFFPVIPSDRKRVVIFSAGLVLVILWVMIFASCMNCNMGQFMTAFLWAFLIPFGALIAVMCGLERAAYKKMTRADS